jgi:cysteine desulfurase
MIYLDHNATTPIDERVLDAMLPYLSSFYGNPSSLYRSGRAVRSAIETAREQVAALVNCLPAQIVFTSGGTEANNLAIKGFAYKNSACRMAVSSIEHPSVLAAAQALRGHGYHIDLLAVDGLGQAKLSELERICTSGLDLLSIMLANNETGVIQDMAGIAEVCRRHQVCLHTDAVQAVGKIPVDFMQLGVQMLSLSSHKIYGPKGSGALIIDRKIELDPLFTGGGQESALRPGTENTAAIIGFGKAAELAKLELQQRTEHLLKIRDQLEAGLDEIKGVVVFGRGSERLPNTVQFGLEGIDGEMLLMQLDRKGIAVSSGSACASGGAEPSHVLTAMGIDTGLAKSAIRISLGKSTSSADITRFLEVLKSLVSSPQ